MKKADMLKNYRIDVLGTTVFMSSRLFQFSYVPPDDIVKDEFKGKYRYFGGLQCEYDQDSVEYKQLEKWLCGIAESVLNVGKKQAV